MSHKIGEVNEAAMSDQVLCPAQLFHLAFSPANPFSQAGVRRVSNDVMGRISPKQDQEAKRPPYFEKLVGILGLGSGSSVIAAFNNFDKQALIAIHNKGLKNFTEVATGEYFCMHYNVEEESQIVQKKYEHLESAQELVPVHLRDLVIGDSKCNECAVLYGELCVVPFKFGKIHTVMKEADTEDAVALSIVSSDPLSINQSLARKTYPKGMKIALKEPRLVKSKNGFIFIDVNNPLSIERIDTFQSPSNVADTINARFEQWFGDGDRAHKEKDWNKCARNYTRCQLYGLSTNTGHDQILKRGFKLLSERCRAYIELQRYTEGLQDAEKCWQLEPSNTISNALKVESLVALGKYKAAYNFIQSCSKSMKQHNTAIFRQKCMEYYDIGDSIAGISTGKLEIRLSEPDADFIGAVEIKMTENGCGRGMFATESIKAGEILLISKALAICDKYYSTFMFDPLENGLVQNVRNALGTKGDRSLQHFLSHDQENFKSIIPKMSEFAEEPQFAGGNSYTLEKISVNAKLKALTENAREMYKNVPGIELYTIQNIPDSSKPRVLKENVREIFKNISSAKVLEIIKRIAFDDRSPVVIEESTQLSNAMSSYNKERSFFGVWLLPSFINHSCAPNASRINVGRDVMRVHATKDINRGEQITIPYFDVLIPSNRRQSQRWGFMCLCHRCELEKFITKSKEEGRLCFDRFLQAYHTAAMSWLNSRYFLQPCNTHFGSNAAGRPIDLESMSILSFDVEFFSKDNIEGQEHRCWFISAFTLCYLAFLVVMMKESGREDPAEYEDDTAKTYREIVRELIEAIAGTCPGDAQYLVLCQKNVHSLTKLAAAARMGGDIENHRMYSYAVERAKEESKKACICVYGQQKADVAEAILTKYSNKRIL